MKTVLILLALVWAAPAWAQKEDAEPPKVDGLYRYEGVVEVDGATADQLFDRARLWAFDAFTSFKDVNHTTDRESGTILIVGNTGNLPSRKFGFTGIGGGIVKFKMSIYVKDGRYKYVVTDLVHKGTHRNHSDLGALETTKSRGMPIKEIKAHTHRMLSTQIEKLDKAMRTKAESEF